MNSRRLASGVSGPDGRPDVHLSTARKTAQTSSVTEPAGPAATLPNPIHYATYFDRHYLTRGLALYRSLDRHSPPFLLWVLCLDDQTRWTLERLALKHVALIPLAELERHDPDLLAVKAGRQPIEYYFTCTAALLVYLLDRHPQIDTITYLDADTFFFGDPTPIYEELGDGSILLIPYRRPARWEHRNATRGRFPVMMEVFRRTEDGLACVRRWREQSIEWCFDRMEEGRFGDQKYLDEWPDLYPSLRVSQHIGAGVALWNLSNYRVTRRNGQLFVDEHPVIFCHFNRFRILNRWLFDTALGWFGDRVTPGVKPLIHAPYARALQRAREEIRAVGGEIPPLDSIRYGRPKPSQLLAALRQRRLLLVTDAFVLY